MKAASLLILSLGLNAALAIAAAWSWRQPTPGDAAFSEQTIRPLATAIVVTNLPPETTFVTNRFHWRQLESTNHDELAANLRVVGCPERTIRDIVIGDVWQVYGAREKRGDMDRPFWLNGMRRAELDRQEEAELRALKTDLAATLRRLFGITWTPELKRDIFEDEQAICRLLLGDVSEDQFGHAAGLIMLAVDGKDDVRWNCRGVYLDEDYAEVRRRRGEIERELRGVLSPAQFEEFSARAGMFETMFAGEVLQDLKTTPDEMRQMGLAMTQVRPLGWKFMDLDDAESQEQKDAAKEDLEARMLKILGEARFGEFQRLQDGNYRQIRSFAEQKQLPNETASKLYEIRKLAQDEVRRVREDQALDPDARSQRLATVTTDIAKEVGALLGSKVFADYLRHNGHWVTNVNRL